MGYRKNKKKFSLAFRKEVALKAVSEKRKLEEQENLLRIILENLLPHMHSYQ